MWKILIFLCLIYVNYASDTPVIGILSQEMYIVAKYFPGEHYESFIAASYVKFLESAGAKVVPVWIGQSDEYYQRVVNYTNGILFPGGGTYFNETGGYGQSAKTIYHLAMKNNDRNIYYPLWGICMGFQVLIFAQKGIDLRTDCSLKKVALPLDFTEGYESSDLFSKAPREILRILGTKNVTYNQHQYCLTEEVLNNNGVLTDWNILSTNRDASNVEFISTMENRKYPFYGVQYHPEKNIFEFKDGVGIPHTIEAVQVSQFFANFFVNKCRKNNNTFPDEQTEMNSLIYNYNPVYTAPRKSSYQQIYVFTKDDYEKSPLV
ncbi:gamma-glutamyl hydrolase isoform X1 [Leptinotarsa decemlineata]|uniref:gamma-glutamyl hydrolase isoform X1 n=1 Tax=Leptinotarsa decemlineata TaxID=7539 RepID=UPI003D30A271